jgi:hypothetical protein
MGFEELEGLRTEVPFHGDDMMGETDRGEHSVAFGV